MDLQVYIEELEELNKKVPKYNNSDSYEESNTILNRLNAIIDIISDAGFVIDTHYWLTTIENTRREIDKSQFAKTKKAKGENFSDGIRHLKYDIEDLARLIKKYQ